MKKLVVLILLLMLPVMAMAQGPGKGFGHGKGLGFFKDLDLSQEQRDQLRALKDKRQDMRGSWSELRNEKDELHKLFSDPNIDEAELSKRANEFRERQSEAFAQRLDHMLEVRRIVGPEKFGQIADKFREKMKGRFGRAQGGMGGCGQQ